MTTKEQRQAWDEVCEEGRSVGLVFVHIPDTSFWTVYSHAPKGVEVHYIRNNSPDEAIKAAKDSVAFKRAYPVPTNDPAEQKARYVAFNARAVA